MQPIRSLAAAFDALDAKNKARWIAGVCAILGILSGFVLFIVLTHTFEHGDLGVRMLALVLGLIVSIGIARIAEWLSETIATGEANLGHMLARAVPAAIILLIVFEMCVSTFEDFAKASIADFSAVSEIAARVAGQPGDKAAIVKDEKIEALLGSILEKMKNPVWRMLPGVEQRLVTLMPARLRVPVFHDPVSDQEIIALARELARTEPNPLGTAAFDGYIYAPMGWKQMCRNVIYARSPENSATTPLGQMMTMRPTREAQIALCRDSLADRVEPAADLFVEGINAVLRRHDFYDPIIFGPGERGRALSEAAEQRALCDKISFEAAMANQGRPTCLDAALDLPEIAAKYPGLLPRASLVTLNREILARALPETFSPAPINWTDFLLLAAVWCVAAVSLAVLLSDAVFAIARGGLSLPGWTRIARNAGIALAVAPIATGVVLVVLRLFSYIWTLMFDPAAVAPEHVWSGVAMVFQVVPLAVDWLHNTGLWGLTIPGYVSLPLVVIGLACVAIFSSESDSPLSFLATAALGGLLIFSIGPVVGGVISVMLLIVVTWLVPTLGLSALLPYLEPGGRVPRWWGAIAAAAAVVLAVWALFRWWKLMVEPDGDIVGASIMIAASFSLALTSIFILRERPVRDLWPLAAVTVAFCLLGGALGVQQATFYGVLREMAGVTEMKYEARPADPAYLSRDFFAYLYAGKMQDRDVEPSAAHAEAEVREAAHLELALVGALGFWLTIALLAAWSLREREESAARGEAHGDAPPQAAASQ